VDHQADEFRPVASQALNIIDQRLDIRFERGRSARIKGVDQGIRFLR